MAVTVAGYWMLPGRVRDLWLVAVTVTFLGVYAPLSAVLLAGFAVATYLLASRVRASGPIVVGAIAAILAVLVYYKLHASFEFTDVVREVAIPLGLSYYAFRCIHYLIEQYKGTIPRHSFQEFFGYLFYLPTLMAGPIHRFQEFNRDMRRKRWDGAKFSEGLERMLFGYVKIAFLANYLVSVRVGEFIAGIDPERSALIAYLTMIQKGFNGYLQFAGYTDIAIGFGLLLGYRVMENFNWPFIRKNISEFWKSWHISLSSWCRDYIYMGVISVTRQPALAAIAAMLVLGLWHEISYRYLLWGLYNGVGIAVWQRFQDVKPHLPKIESPALQRVALLGSVALTFHFVMFGFVIVQEKSLGTTLSIYKQMLLFWL